MLITWYIFWKTTLTIYLNYMCKSIAISNRGLLSASLFSTEICRNELWKAVCKPVPWYGTVVKKVIILEHILHLLTLCYDIQACICHHLKKNDGWKPLTFLLPFCKLFLWSSIFYNTPLSGLLTQPRHTLTIMPVITFPVLSLPKAAGFIHI